MTSLDFLWELKVHISTHTHMYALHTHKKRSKNTKTVIMKKRNMEKDEKRKNSA